MAIISLSNNSSGENEVPTVQRASTTSTQVSTVSTNVATASLSYDTVCAFIATQPNRSQIKYEDISKIDDDDIEDIDIKWNLALLSMRADRKRKSYKKDPKVEEPAPKAMIAIDGIGWDWSYMAKEDEASKNHALMDEEEEVPTGYALIARSSSSSDNETLGSQKLDKDMKGVRFNEYCFVPPPPTQVYSPLKKDLSWMGLPEFVDDTVTGYTRPTPSIDVSKSVSKGQEERWKSNNPSFFEQGGSFGNVVSKPMIKFVKESGCPNATKVNNTKNTRKPTIKYAKMHITGNISNLFEYEPFNGGYVSFGHRRGKITGKGSIKTGYSLSSKAFRVFNKRTNKIEDKLHVDFLENKSIEKGTSLDWLFDIDTLTNSMNYVPVVYAGTSSTNISASSNAAASKDDAITVNNAPQHEQEEVNRDKEVPKSSRNSNHTASTKVSTNDSFELASSSTVETEVPTISILVPTDSLYVPLITSSVPRIISKGGSSFLETLSLGNLMSFENRLEDFFRNTSNAVSLNEVEADLRNMETSIQEEGINYEEVFAPVARIEAIRLFIAYASYMGFIVYQMDVKSAFLYGTIDEEVYVMQPPSFQDPELPHSVYKVENAMYGLH
nr:ribonuclease H-like domain, reverse transcriptase, RNA-dependent DNA polymerase [Tanacetum cinerariifolium]